VRTWNDVGGSDRGIHSGNFRADRLSELKIEPQNLTNHETEKFGIVLIIYYKSFLHVANNGSAAHSASYSIGSRG
jgi:hypothetical protein